jgi:hypothetical protein
MTTSAGHSFYIEPIGSFDNQVNDTGSWEPLVLLAIVLSVLWYTDSDYPFGIFWPLCCLFFDIQILITSLWYTDSDYLPLIYRFWLPLWYHQIFLRCLIFSVS